MTASVLRFGMLTMQHPPWSGLLDRWRAYEALGFDSVWVCDHFIGQRGEPLFEAWTLLAALAARTRRVRLGAVVTCNSFRHPALLAKEAITVDHVSGGRLELGLGAGWWEAEHPMFGIPFPPPAERVTRFQEAVEVLNRLLSPAAGPVSYSGRYYQVENATVRPVSVQQPRPPLMLAGQGPRMLEIVARHADTWVASFGLRPEEMATRNRFLDERCRALGRDPASLRRAFVWAPWVHALDPWDAPEAFVDFVDRYHEAGVTEFILDEPRPDQQPTLERIAREVLPGLRAREPS
jgi:alkanesulfonate monooxygenase SsuD/methylene tetrahydromethanopterin reductase-like flavin-dependent oxidoreductase (luciferase family)